MQTQTLNISLPKDLVKEVDKQAKKEYRNRSEFIRQALSSYIEKRSRWERILAEGKEYGKKMGIKSEEDVNRIVRDYRHGRKSSR